MNTTFHTPAVTSRLPRVGTTIFTVMSALAQQHNAVNLGQGFPDFDCAPELLDAVNAAMRSGLNQYPPMAGVPLFRAAIAAKVAALYGHDYDPGTEITVTAGATQAIITAILALVHPGDEVIVPTRVTTATSPTSNWPAVWRCTCRSRRAPSRPTSR